MRTFTCCRISIAFFCFLLFSSASLVAQIRCYTDEHEKNIRALHPEMESKDAFEQWMKKKLAGIKVQNFGDRTESVTYTIPVVYHVIHNGEAIGVGTNLSDAQLQSNILSLNRDYNRLNADSVNTPAEFKPAAGKINIEFVLAKQDPEGLPTNGITRTKGNRTSYSEAQESEFKSLAFWPPENYVNIWVLNLNAGSLLAYAELPTSSGLPGLETASPNRLVDGIAALYTIVGDNSFGGNFNLNTQYINGRTLVHEMGHILGLRHIWGDDTVDCTGNDYCDDTPPQIGPTYGCPVHPQVSCSSDKMFQNYMDYTNDVCYNLFTKDQIDRMMVVLANSPRRASLLSSPGANDPSTPLNELGLRKVITPDITACANTPITPMLQIRNYGSNNVTTAKIQFSVNGTVFETKDFPLNLAYTDTTNVTFSQIVLTANSTVSFTIISTNGTTDANSANNTISQTVTLPSSVAVPFVQTFDGTPPGWTIINPDGTLTWKDVTAPFTSPSNLAMSVDFYDYEDVGQQDKLVSPVFDLSTVTVATLKFDVAYAQFNASSADQLRVLVSTSCDTHNNTEVFNSAGAQLATSQLTTSAFIPKTASDWRTQTIPLTAFLGQSHVQITFIATNQNGNNLYLDNVSVSTDSFTDIALVALDIPEPVSCETSPVPKLKITNNGSTSLTTFTVTTLINNSATTTQTFSNLDFTAGETMDITLDAWSLKTGTNSIKLTVTTPGTDIVPSNNTLSVNHVVNTAVTSVPVNQNFEASFSDWATVSPTQGTNWKSIATNTLAKGISLFYGAFGNNVLGSQAWLVTPTIDLSQFNDLSLSFDMSYAQSVSGDDQFQILASTDCGVTYPTIIYDAKSSDLASGYPDTNTPPNNDVTQKSNTSFAPQTNLQWKNISVNLDAPVLGASQARLAFVFTNDDGNNFYIDNITISDPTAIILPSSDHYAVYNNLTPSVKVTFNLPAKETVRIQVINPLGAVMIDNVETDVQQQTYTLDMTGRGPGIFIVRLQMGSELGATRVLILN